MARTTGSHGMQCPHCEHHASCSKTSRMSETTRRKVYRCSNLDCGHVFEAYEQIASTLVMSASPNAQVKLPFSEQLKAAVRHAAQSI